MEINDDVPLDILEYEDPNLHPLLKETPEVDDLIAALGGEKTLQRILKSAAKVVGKASAGAYSGRATPITMRIPSDILAQYKTRAETHCVPYQRLMIRQLRAGMQAWRAEDDLRISKS